MDVSGTQRYPTDVCRIVVGAPTFPIMERNMNPCAPCRMSRKRCEGGYPCERCQLKGLQDICSRPPRPARGARRSMNSACGSDDTGIQFIIEDPSSWGPRLTDTQPQERNNAGQVGLSTLEVQHSRAPLGFEGLHGREALYSTTSNVGAPEATMPNTNQGRTLAEAPGRAFIAGALNLEDSVGSNQAHDIAFDSDSAFVQDGFPSWFYTSTRDHDFYQQGDWS